VAGSVMIIVKDWREVNPGQRELSIPWGAGWPTPLPSHLTVTPPVQSAVVAARAPDTSAN
jgi:hypothetical protein